MNDRYFTADFMAAIALEFDGYIRDLLTVRRQAGDAARDDITTRLLRERVWDRTMTDDEIVSLLRNWTVGELTPFPQVSESWRTILRHTPKPSDSSAMTLP